MAGGADAALVNLAHTGGATLGHDLRREIDLVMRPANARAELHHQISGVHLKAIAQQLYCIRRDGKRTSFLARMHQPDSTPTSIDEINRAAIRDINPETNITLICDEAVAIFETAIAGERRIEHGDLVAMNLPRRSKRAFLQAKLAPGAAMHLVEVREDGRFVVRQLDAGHTSHETVRHIELLQRAKPLERKLAIFQQIGRACAESCSSPHNRH